MRADRDDRLNAGPELLAPAGDLDKLRVAYRYGADAAYIGLSGFSLRAKGSEISFEERAAELAQIKDERRLYGALNVYFHDSDIDTLRTQIDLIATLPLDAIIVSDVGIVELVQKGLPDVELHLSTQANCLNAEAARFYYKIGFSRIVPAREMSIDDIKRIKDRTPELEIEAFVHGAMCLAYSGRCLLSAWESGRSANKGNCSHSCRWNYRRYIEEEKRPGEYFPVEEGDGFSTILSPRDLCMIDHLETLQDAGVDALKIEGRMKSEYYVAIVTRAYRKELDRIAVGAPREVSQPFIDELANVSHREFSTGFYFGDPKATDPTEKSYNERYRYVASLGREVAPGRFLLDVKNSFDTSEAIEVIGPDIACATVAEFALYNLEGNRVDRVTHHSGGAIESAGLEGDGFLIRKPR
ncbi:MAG: U32 family peptidase [Spirochaetales bacterium]